jgi:hypothetical protein
MFHSQCCHITQSDGEDGDEVDVDADDVEKAVQVDDGSMQNVED